MISQATIRTALEARLATMSGYPALVVRENDALPGPAAATAWLQLAYLWGNRQIATMPAAGGTVWMRGIFQVTIHNPLGKGAGGLDTFAAAIAAVFLAGTVLAVAGRALRIRECRMWPAERDETWFDQVVDVTWVIAGVNA